MQTANNSDFEIEAKFQSKLTSAYQMQGIIIQQDNNNYLRFDFSRYSQPIQRSMQQVFTAGFAPDNKIHRSNHTRGHSHVHAGKKDREPVETDSTRLTASNWTAAANFNQTLTVSISRTLCRKCRHFARQPLPALIDYFFNTSSPSCS